MLGLSALHSPVPHLVLRVHLFIFTFYSPWRKRLPGLQAWLLEKMSVPMCSVDRCCLKTALNQTNWHRHCCTQPFAYCLTCFNVFNAKVERCNATHHSQSPY